MLFTINGNTNDLNGNMLPLCLNGIGGILLFSDTIEENPDRYYAPSANPCVGYASNDVNAATNVMRGSMNLTETKRLDNGYRFVWDFTTSQANGTISCVALTHKWAGLAYMGDTYNGTGFVWTMRSRNSKRSINLQITTQVLSGQCVQETERAADRQELRISMPLR